MEILYQLEVTVDSSKYDLDDLQEFQLIPRTLNLPEPIWFFDDYSNANLSEHCWTFASKAPFTTEDVKYLRTQINQAIEKIKTAGSSEMQIEINNYFLEHYGWLPSKKGFIYKPENSPEYFWGVQAEVFLEEGSYKIGCRVTTHALVQSALLVFNSVKEAKEYLCIFFEICSKHNEQLAQNVNPSNSKINNDFLRKHILVDLTGFCKGHDLSFCRGFLEGHKPHSRVFIISKDLWDFLNSKGEITYFENALYFWLRSSKQDLKEDSLLVQFASSSQLLEKPLQEP